MFDDRNLTIKELERENKQLKDKLHRRNMQIKDLKAEVSRLEEIHNINLDSIAKLETKLLQ